MNNNIKYMAYVLFAGLAMTACSPDDFEGANQNGIPTVSGVEISVDVDQATNTVTMSSPHLMQAYPYWYMPANEERNEVAFHSTLERTSRVFAQSGDKKIIYRVGNRNGFSQGTIEKTIHINNSLKDLEGIAKAMTSAEGKQWRVAKEEEAHFGYGPKGGDGSGTWVAAAGNKDELALYDDFINLKSGTSNGNFLYNGTMSYNPGGDGKVQFGGVGEGDNKSATPQNGNYKISVSGDDVLLTLAPGTYMPFVPSESFLSNPVFRIDAYSANLLVLVAEDGDKAWRLVLTSADFGGSGEIGWEGFTGGVNLLEGITLSPSFYYAPGWAKIDDPVYSGDVNEFKLSFPQATSEQWQNQVHLATGVTLSADKTYDFSIVIVSDNDIPGVTVKPHPNGNDDVYFSADRHEVKANTPTVVALGECAGFDGELVITLDFAGNPDNTNVTVKNMYVAEHVDENVLPLNYNDAANVWRTEIEEPDAYEMSFWWSDANWKQIANPGFDVSKKKSGANVYTITAPAATSAQWQAQNSFVTKMTATMSDVIDFSCIVVPNMDLNNVMVKFTEADEGDVKHDTNFFFANQVNLKAGVPNVVKFTGTQLPNNDAHAMNLIFDFGGNPEGAVIQITDITMIKKTAE